MVFDSQWPNERLPLSFLRRSFHMIIRLLGSDLIVFVELVVPRGLSLRELLLSWSFSKLFCSDNRKSSGVKSSSVHCISAHGRKLLNISASSSTPSFLCSNCCLCKMKWFAFQKKRMRWFNHAQT